MQINPKIIKKQFEKSFDLYEQNAVVQKLMAEKLVNNLSGVRKQFDTVLELGCGTGVLTKEFVKKFRFSEYYANDLVEKSKIYIKEILPDATFFYGNALKIKPKKKVDLIVSNAMFQWFNSLKSVAGYCNKLLENDGILAFSTFSDKNFQEIKSLTGLSLDYKSFESIQDEFKNDFEILYAEEFQKKLMFSNPLELLAHMKNTGVNSLMAQRWTFKQVKEFCDKYKEKYPDISLTYSPVIIVCKKCNEH